MHDPKEAARLHDEAAEAHDRAAEACIASRGFTDEQRHIQGHDAGVAADAEVVLSNTAQAATEAVVEYTRTNPGPLDEQAAIEAMYAYEQPATSDRHPNEAEQGSRAAALAHRRAAAYYRDSVPGGFEPTEFDPEAWEKASDYARTYHGVTDEPTFTAIRQSHYAWLVGQKANAARTLAEVKRRLAGGQPAAFIQAANEQQDDERDTARLLRDFARWSGGFHPVEAEDQIGPYIDAANNTGIEAGRARRLLEEAKTRRIVTNAEARRLDDGPPTYVVSGEVEPDIFDIVARKRELIGKFDLPSNAGKTMEIAAMLQSDTKPIDPNGPLGKALIADFEEFEQKRTADNPAAIRIPTDLDAFLDQRDYVVKVGERGLNRIRQLLREHEAQKARDLIDTARLLGDFKRWKETLQPHDMLPSLPSDQLETFLQMANYTGIETGRARELLQRATERQLGEAIKKWAEAEAADPPEQGLWEAEVATLEAMPIYGNHAMDSPAFDRAHAILTSKAEIPLKLRALKRVNDMMGVEEEADETSVTLYLAENAEADGDDEQAKLLRAKANQRSISSGSWPKTSLEGMLDAGQLRERIASDLARLVTLVPEGDLRSLALTGAADAAVVLGADVVRPIAIPVLLNAEQLRERVGDDMARMARLLDPEEPESVLYELASDAKNDAQRRLAEGPIVEQPLEGEDWDAACKMVQNWLETYSVKDWVRLILDWQGSDWVRNAAKQEGADHE